MQWFGRNILWGGIIVPLNRIRAATNGAIRIRAATNGASRIRAATNGAIRIRDPTNGAIRIRAATNGAIRTRAATNGASAYILSNLRKQYKYQGLGGWKRQTPLTDMTFYFYVALGAETIPNAMTFNSYDAFGAQTV